MSVMIQKSTTISGRLPVDGIWDIAKARAVGHADICWFSCHLKAAMDAENGCKWLIRYIQEHIWKILEGASHTHKLHENIGS